MTSPIGSLIKSVKTYAGTHGRLVILLVFVVTVVRFSAMPRPPDRDVDAIAAMLGQSVGGTVKPDDFVWEGRGGVLNDALLGRRVLFLAAKPAEPNASPTNDLYRAEVRLTRAGRPIALRRVVNLTNTPRGHEHDLVAQGVHAAFATKVGSFIQTISVLELDGDQRVWEGTSRMERWAAGIENWLGTGTRAGVGRIETSFGTPPKTARFELTQDALVMALGESAQAAAVSLSDASVNAGPKDEHGVQAQRLPHPVTPWSRFVEESVRAAWGEARASDVRRIVVRTSDAWTRMRESSAPKPAELPAAPQSESVPAEKGFPPQLALTSHRVLPGEGIWLAPAGVGKLPGEPKEAPPSFFETHLRPDPKRPHAIVRLVAMDGRRLELRPVAGVLAPRSETGLHGQGKISSSDASISLAVFAGGSPDGASPAGFVVDQQAIAVPRHGAATLAVDRLGRAALGPWPLDEDVPLTLRFVGQSSKALVVDGRLAEFDSTDRESRTRSGLCVTNDGHLLYAGAENVPAVVVAQALLMAGCRDAMALATSPDPVGFGFVQHDGQKGAGTRLWGTQSFDPQRMWNASTNAFVYVVARTGQPDAPLPEAGTWEVDPGPQPEPSWRPALFTASVAKLGAQVKLTLLSPERFLFRIRAGTKEVSHRLGGTFPDALAADEQTRVLLAAGLGTAKRKGPRGLAIGGSIGVKFGAAAGVLVVENERARIEKSEGFAPTADADAAELPLTADEGRPLPEARIVGSMRPRAAIGVLADGSVLIASTTFDTDEATTEALIDAGCMRVVALDRGTHQNAYVHRAGGETPPEAHYESTTLYVLGNAMRGRALSLR